jgi:hypothetical protein
MRSWQPASVPFSCPVIKQEVTVAISTMDHYGQGQFPINQARRMDGCSGAHICKLFPDPRAFHTRGPYGCPIHTSMNGG